MEMKCGVFHEDLAITHDINSTEWRKGNSNKVYNEIINTHGRCFFSHIKGELCRKALLSSAFVNFCALLLSFYTY